MTNEEIKFFLTLRYNPLSPKEYKIQTEIPDIENVDLALSGGIDSHYVLHTLRQERPDLKINCICVEFNDSNWECPHADKLASRYNVGFTCELIDDPLKDLEKYIKIVGEPRWNLYQHFLYEQCKSKVLVTGDGGDEVFAGYTFRYKKFLEMQKDVSSVTNYYCCHERDWVPDFDLFRLDDDIPFDYLFKQFNNIHTDQLDLVLQADYNGKLKHDFLPCNYKLSQHAGIQLITPLLKHKLRPWRDLYDPVRNLGKLPLRRVINRWDDTKLGFGFDIVKYWNRIGRDKIKPILDNKSARIYKIINWEWYQKHKESIDVRYINKFLQLYALELYLKCYS